MSEHSEQAALFRWAELAAAKYPALHLLYAIPNGGLRNQIVAIKLKAEGVKPGVPDIHWPVPSFVGHHGLWIEMKYGANKCTRTQDDWHRRLINMGHKVVTCWSWLDAAREICKYGGMRDLLEGLK